MKYLMIYLVIINIVAFVTMAVDKYRAQHYQWRIRESVLFLEAFAGGSLGIWAAMWACHHKTKHKRFTITIPILLLIQIIIVLLLALAAKA